MRILVKNWVFGPNITIIGDDVNFPIFHSLVKQNMNLEIVIMAGIQQVMI